MGIEQEYGFCGTEYYQALEPGSFTLSNSTNLSENFQDSSVSGDQHGAECNADYLMLPGGHCKNDQHHSTDRFCGNSLGVGGIRQPIISYSAVPVQGGDGQRRDHVQHRLHEPGIPPQVPPAAMQHTELDFRKEGFRRARSQQVDQWKIVLLFTVVVVIVAFQVRLS